jgi:hypothetical protein
LEFIRVASVWVDRHRFFPAEVEDWAVQVASFLRDHGTEAEAEAFMRVTGRDIAGRVNSQIAVLEQILVERAAASSGY